MRKKKYHSKKTLGNETEKIIDGWSYNAGLQWESEQVVDAAKRRKKGGIDRIYMLPVKFNIEIKSTGKDSINHNYPLDDKSRDISNDQISILSKAYRIHGEDGGFIFHFRKHRKFIFVHIGDFINHIMTYKWKHIKYETCLEIGLEIKNMEWLKEYVYNPNKTLLRRFSCEKTPIEQIVAIPKEEKPINDVVVGSKLELKL